MCIAQELHSQIFKPHDILAVCVTCSGDAAALTLAAVAIFSCCPAIQQQAGIHRPTVCSWLDIPQIIQGFYQRSVPAFPEIWLSTVDGKHFWNFFLKFFFGTFWNFFWNFFGIFLEFFFGIFFWNFFGIFWDEL